jgi:hypothetical protein
VPRHETLAEATVLVKFANEQTPARCKISVEVKRPSDISQSGAESKGPIRKRHEAITSVKASRRLIESVNDEQWRSDMHVTRYDRSDHIGQEHFSEAAPRGVLVGPINR